MPLAVEEGRRPNSDEMSGSARYGAAAPRFPDCRPESVTATRNRRPELVSRWPSPFLDVGNTETRLLFSRSVSRGRGQSTPTDLGRRSRLSPAQSVRDSRASESERSDVKTVPLAPQKIRKIGYYITRNVAKLH